MSPPFKRFLLESARELGREPRYAALAAFGKHPGWDDHLEDLGLETESLTLAKSLLYVEGIGGQIDTGAWERSDPAKVLPEFNHLFLWCRSGQALLGRLWSSSDGKGRTRYPMVLCFHFVGIPLPWVLRKGLPALNELTEQCSRTREASEVRDAVTHMRLSLRTAIRQELSPSDCAPLPRETIHQLVHPNGGEISEGFLRVLYQVQSQSSKYAIGRYDPRTEWEALRPEQLRVPAAGGSFEESLLFWHAFFSKIVDPAVPLLLMMPLKEPFLDATLGQPGSQEFFCLRASTRAMPLASDVPYNLDQEFRANASDFFETLQSDQPPKLPTRAESNVGTKAVWRRLLGG